MTRNMIFLGIMAIFLTCLNGHLSAEPLFQLNQSSRHYTEIEFSLNNYELIVNNINGNEYHRVYHPEAGLILEEGLPELPVFTTTIAIPNRGTVSLQQIEILDTEILSDILIYPAQGLDIIISEERGFLKDANFYEKNVEYPYHVSQISEPAIVRDFRFVNITVTPFQYNPHKEELTVSRRIILRIDYDAAVQGENEITRNDRRLSRSFENIYRGMFLNYDDMRDPSWEYQARSILAIYHNSAVLEPIVNQFVNWKRDKGFEITAVSTQNMTTNIAIKNYIQNAYDTWENPPEYIILIGGGSGTHTIPYFTAHGAAGDHPYGLLEGNDDIPDAFVGRLPIASSDQLMTIWNKIRSYEREPFLGSTDWYQHTLLVGDTTTSSGISPRFVMKYIKELMEYQSDEYQFTEHYSGSSSTIVNGAFNQGISFFPFRGYIGMASWSPNAGVLNNGQMLPNCFFITCSTLSFSNTSSTETIVNMGAPNTPKGAVAAIGMTTASTRTTPNNALTGSFFYGIFNEGIRTMGETLARGKIFLHQTYGIVHSSLPPVHTQKASLMGDPSMDIWIDVPKVMNVTYIDELPMGRNFIDIVVTDDQGMPIEDAWVTIRQGNDVIFATGYTDANGEITHFFDPDNTGEIKLTVTKPDYIPHLGNFELAGEWSVALEEVIVNDPFDAGSNSSFVLTIRNFLDVAVSGIEGTISTNNPYINIIEGTSSYANAAPDATVESNDSYLVQLSQAAPDFMPVIFTLTITDAVENSWTSKFSLRVNGTNLQPIALLVGDNDHDYINPGSTEMLRVTLQNTGQIDLENVYGALRTRNPLLDISDSLAFFGNIAAGHSVTSLVSDSFLISAMDDLITGMAVELELYLYNNLGFETIQPARLSIGQVSVTDPLGPCDYGYYIYGMEDVDYEYVPTYEWIEIAPQLGGNGVNTGLGSDWQNNQQVMTMDLPFTFRFYGVDYDEISICANGWISFGFTEIASFRNYILPGPMGPSPMVAAFWDNLSLSSGGVFTYYDQEDELFIIQWQNAMIPGSHQNTFQIILYNPELEPTIDDGYIKIQYKVFNNLNGGTLYGDWSNFSTIGIGDHTSDVGLTYTFANQYPTAAATITNESALMIVGPKNYSEPFLVRGDIVVFDENNNGIIEAGENVQIGIYIKNIGFATAESVTGTISTASPYIMMLNNSSIYEDIHSGGEIVNNQFFEFNISSATPNNSTISFEIEITADNAHATFPFHITVRRPSLDITSYMIEEVNGNGNGIIDPGETINLVLQLTNPSLSMIENGQISISTTNQYLTINNPSISIGDIPAETNLQQAVSLEISENCPIGEIVSLIINVNADNISTFSREIFIGVAQEDIFHDFEVYDGGFISNNDDGWQWGEPNIAAYSGSKVWGTVLDGNYADGANWTLDTPNFLITPASLLSFYHLYNIENYWDGGNVKISTDGGNSWQVIHPIDGYPVANTNSGNSGIPNQPAYSGNSNGWQEATFELDQYFGQLARFRYHFGSGPWVNEIGWYLDDFSINGINQLFSVISGNVEMLRSPYAVNNVLITTGDYTVKPDLNGNYKLVVPPGNYNVTAWFPYHFQDLEYQVTVGELDFITDIDFTLLYLTPAENLRYSLHDEIQTVELSWTYDPLPDYTGRSRGNLRNDDYYFTIYRQTNSGHFIEIGTTTELSYTDQIATGDFVYRYYVVTEYSLGSSEKSNTISTDSQDYDTDDLIPPVNEFALRQNYPNPFNPVTNISFSLPQHERVNLRVYNIKGELVRTILDEEMPAGEHTVQWTGLNNQNRRVSSGIYFYRLEAGNYNDVKKAVLLK